MKKINTVVLQCFDNAVRDYFDSCAGITEKGCEGRRASVKVDTHTREGRSHA